MRNFNNKGVYLYTHCINEEFQQFNRGNTQYEELIDEIANALLNLYLYRINLVKVYNNNADNNLSILEFSKYEVETNGLIPNVKNYIFYLCLTKKLDDSEVICSENIDIREYTNDVKPLYIKGSNHYMTKQISIILKIPYNEEKEDIDLDIIPKIKSRIHQELLHVLHSIDEETPLHNNEIKNYKKSYVLQRNSAIFYYIEKLMDIYNILEFPVLSELIMLNTNNLSSNDFRKIIIACFYYFDASEYSAWLQSYMSELEYNNTTPTDSNFYNVYKNLSLLLEKYKSDIEKQYLEDIQNNKIKNCYNAIFKECFQKTIQKYANNPSIMELLNKWEKRSYTFMNKCNKVFNYKK